MKSCYRCLAAAVALLFLSAMSLSSFNGDSEGGEYKRALLWLGDQVVPNRQVSKPLRIRKGMVLSYLLDGDDKDYAALHDKSFLYDNAMAIIAFSMAGDADRARSIIGAVLNDFTRTGNLYFSYSLRSLWPTPGKDDHGSIIRTGASAWYGYAVCLYIELINPPDHERRELLVSLERIAAYLETYRVRDQNSPLQGLYRGGENRHTFHNGKEEYHREPVLWASTEHNIDMYFFLRALGSITGDRAYTGRSETLGRLIVHNLWSDRHGQFYQGMGPEGTDGELALDCASWGAPMLLASGRKDLAEKALAAAERYRIREGDHDGYAPYIESAGDGYRIRKPFFLIWPEGSLGVAVAHFKLGNVRQGRNIIDAIEALMDRGGGIPYATKDVPQHFSRYASAASAAWLVIARTMEKDRNIRTVFWR